MKFGGFGVCVCGCFFFFKHYQKWVGKHSGFCWSKFWVQAEDKVSVGASLLARVREYHSPAEAGPRQWSWERAETVQALRIHHKVLIQAPHPLASQQGQNNGGRFQARPVGKASRYKSSKGQYGFFRWSQ